MRPHQRAVVLEAIKVWPGKGEACRKVGVIANLYRFCAHLCQRWQVGTKKRALRSNQETDEGKLRALANSLTTKTPYKGPGADSEEKREPVSDIDIAVADSLKVLDLKRPIREEWTSRKGGPPCT